MSRTAALCCVAYALSAQPVRADSDLFLGTWRLNPSASTYQSGDVPASMTIIMETTPQGIHYRSQTELRDHRTTTAQYTAAYGGQQALVIGDAGFLTPVKLARIDAHTVAASYVRGGSQVVAESRRVLSADGKKMTITTVFKAKDGKAVTNVGIYEKASQVTRQ